ncbi:MAG TPA: 5'-nucleotidase C-terminal domain-containing protein [Lachnospiraceae bacterium]|nr:5'-nucleotidase C-terminal domain-containing protein [Lachnospiraceae bacterium]
MRFRMKKAFAILLAVVMVFSGKVMFASAETTSTSSDSSVTIQVLATSDLHGRFVPYDYAVNTTDTSGSLAQVASVVKSLRNDNTLLIDVGDTIQDNSSDLFLKDDLHPMIAGMNALGYDTWTLGNHEFNYGMDTLKKIMKQSKAAVLGGNIYNADGTGIAKDYEIFEKNGVKIAVIGMVTPNITKWDAENLKTYKVTDPVAETKKIVNEVKDKVDVIIAAEHMSESNEYGVSNSGTIDLANTCPEIDLIIAAHEHKGVEGAYYNNVLTVENKSGGQTVAKVDITLKKDSDGGYDITNRTSKLIPTNTYSADAQISSQLAKYDATAKADANVVIGKLQGGDLVPANEITGIPQSQLQETAMINLINAVQMYYTGADVSAAAVFNTNANMKVGDIKKCDTALIYKYANTLYKLQMTGAQLKKYMEWSVSYYNTYKPGDLTVSFNPDIRAYNYDMFSGVTYDVNISKEPGSRIENLKKADGTPIKNTDVLTIAVNNYRANSQLLSAGTVYSKGEALPKLLETDVKGCGIRELIGEYITDVKKGVITPELSGNWKLIGNSWNSELHSKVAELVAAGTIKIPTSEDGRTPNVKSIKKADIASYVTITAPEKVNVESVISKKAKTAVVTIAKVNSADGYTISYTTDKNFANNVKTITTTEPSVTIKSLKSKTKYYVKVSAFRYDMEEKLLTGEYSSVKSVKVK